jgi:heterotetrameric sarcosine oxidase gamma subunit
MVAESFAKVEAEAQAARQGVVLADESANAKVLVQGERAAQVVQEVFSTGEMGIGAGVHSQKGRVYRLRRDLFLVGAAPGGEEGVVEAVEAGRGDCFVTVTDLTHGRAEIRVAGPASRALMSKVCGLDLAALENGAARQSSVAKTAQLVLRRDLGGLPGFALVGGPSLAQYLWDTLAEAGAEWRIRPIGRRALRLLEESS